MDTSRSSSRASSFSSRRAIGLSLDLTDLPPLSQPAVPTNTLLFTNLNNLDIFQADNLQSIRDLIAQTSSIHAFAPLKSFRRILISFFTEQAAIDVRAKWDGENVMGDRLRVYFGQATSVEDKDEHLALPDAGKLFFISPPPSPPHGWEMRLEDAPNKLVHADDLAEALSKLHHHHDSVSDTSDGLPLTPSSATDRENSLPFVRTRSRSSTLIFQPGEHGASPGLPAVMVEDMTDEPEEMSPIESGKAIMAHTARPPVELMH